MKTFLFILFAMACLASCNLGDNYGKKVEFGKSEVFYKGDAVSEKDAKAVGNFLKEKEWFSKESAASAQVIKEDGIYMVRLVLADPKSFKPDMRLRMWKLENDLSEDVFDGKDARFAFTDEKFKELDVLEPVGKLALGKSAIYYDNSEFRKSEAQKLGKYLEEKEYLGDEKEVDVFLTKEEVPVVRLVVNKDLVEEKEDEIIPVFSYWHSQIQEGVLKNKKSKMILANTSMKDFKTVPKLTAEWREKFETQTTKTETENNTALDSISTQTKVSGIERIRD
jgi:hypothetical protein